MAMRLWAYRGKAALSEPQRGAPFLDLTPNRRVRGWARSAERQPASRSRLLRRAAVRTAAQLLLGAFRKEPVPRLGHRRPLSFRERTEGVPARHLERHSAQ